MLTKEQLDKYTNIPNYSDIECVGFWDDVHTLEDVHTICSIVDDPDTGEEVILVFHDRPDLDGATVFDPYDKKEYTIPERAGTLKEGFRFWYRVGQSEEGFLSVHNCFGYDKPITEKVLPTCIIPKEKWEDTFILSKIQYFDRPTPKGAKSAHGLQAYALRMGIHKPEITDFTKMDAFMLHRVIEDCKTQRYASKYLQKEREMCLNKLGIDFTEGYKNEVDYAIICQKQEVYGTKIDLDHVHKCVEYLDKTLDDLTCYIEPLLPPTVKPQGSKITRKEMAEALGYPDSVVARIKDAMEVVNRNGEQITVPVKPYYKPTTKYTLEKKSNVYSGFHLSYGDSPQFVKKKELTDWIKSNYPDTKPKEWEIEKEEKIVTLLNSNACKYFDLQPEDVDVIGGAYTRVKFEQSKLSQHEIVKGFLITQGVTWAEDWNLKKDVDGQIMKAEEDTVISYPSKASYENQIHKTIKKGEALVTSPKFGDNEYAQLETEIGKDIAKYNTLVHRRRYLSNEKDPENKGLLSAIRADGRVSAGVNNFNTSTGRGSHRVIVNLPADGAVFGKEMRQCVIADEGKELVGIDQKSSQLSICAFVTNNTEYYNAVATGLEMRNEEDGSETYVGTSAHCVNARYFNLVTKEEWEEAVKTQHEELIHSITLRRKKSKSLSFASLFGCGAGKLALMGGFEKDDAAKKLKAFLDNMGLSGVIEFLEYCKEKYKRGSGFYIPTFNGYWVFCTGMHKAVNYLIQSVEGAIQKRAIILMDQEITKRDWIGKVDKILDIHDEVLFECDKGLGIEAGKMAMDCYTQAGKDLFDYYNNNRHLYSGGEKPLITCDFAGSFSVGTNYYECH
jgi:hypothetical protein